jgi:hypothetical protein
MAITVMFGRRKSSNSQIIPEDIQEKLLLFAKAGLSVAWT